ncbi:MAG: photosynthetic complex assembly protein PuhC [Geminicoccaceae bacterium]
MRETSPSTIPRAAVWAMGGLMVLTVILAGIGRAGGFGTAAPEQQAAVASAELRFEDRTDGSVAVYGQADGRTIAVLPPGSNGFIRGVLRGFARERRQYEVGQQPPFRLTRWEGGGMTLYDPQTGRSVELEAFGQTNFAAFARLLPDGSQPS